MLLNMFTAAVAKVNLVAVLKFYSIFVTICGKNILKYALTHLQSCLRVGGLSSVVDYVKYLTLIKKLLLFFIPPY